MTELPLKTDTAGDRILSIAAAVSSANSPDSQCQLQKRNHRVPRVLQTLGGSAGQRFALPQVEAAAQGDADLGAAEIDAVVFPHWFEQVCSIGVSIDKLIPGLVAEIDASASELDDRGSEDCPEAALHGLIAERTVKQPIAITVFCCQRVSADRLSQAQIAPKAVFRQIREIFKTQKYCRSVQPGARPQTSAQPRFQPVAVGKKRITTVICHDPLKVNLGCQGQPHRPVSQHLKTALGIQTAPFACVVAQGQTRAVLLPAVKHLPAGIHGYFHAVVEHQAGFSCDQFLSRGRNPSNRRRPGPVFEFWRGKRVVSNPNVGCYPHAVWQQFDAFCFKADAVDSTE